MHDAAVAKGDKELRQKKTP